VGRYNTEISCEARVILALAGFVSFISLLDDVLFKLASSTKGRLPRLPDSQRVPSELGMGQETREG
jgi:hypothetical protein